MVAEPDPRVTSEMTAPDSVNPGDDLDIVITYENVGDLDRADALIVVIQGSDPGEIASEVESVTSEVNDPDDDDLLTWTVVKTGNMYQASPPPGFGQQRRVGTGNILTFRVRAKVNQVLRKCNIFGLIRLTDIDSGRILQYPESVPFFIDVS
jgi:hypothetical protein